MIMIAKYSLVLPKKKSKYIAASKYKSVRLNIIYIVQIQSLG